MDNKNIIAILLVIIFILLIALGYTLLPSLNAKQDCKIAITSNETLHNGDNLTVKLTDMNGTPISNQEVNITFIDNDSSKNYQSVVTDSKGVGIVKLDKSAGNYTVNCTYGGNENYTGNSTQKKLTIEEVAVEQVAPQKTTSSSSNTVSSSKSSQEEYRPDVDSGGITREEADYWGWQYTPDHGGHYIGSRDHWDENAGMYHD